MCKIAIIGAGPAGCMAACNLDKRFEITLFDKNSPLKTLLPTGGGKCNLAHAEYDFKELVKSYPRGEKFLYSVFSQFCTAETINFFEKIGIKTYTRNDNRIFPTSNNSQDVRKKILDQLHHCKFQKEEVISIIEHTNGFELQTNKATYLFDYIIIATGGKSNYSFIESLGHTIISPKPALVALKTQPCHKILQGVSVKNCKITAENHKVYGDILFTNDGLTGPAIYELSSINAQKELPYEIIIDFINDDNFDLQNEFNLNPHKNLGNLLNKYLPKSLINTLVRTDLEQKCCTIRTNTKVLVNSILRDFKLTVTGTKKDGETVTCGGVTLDEINSKSMTSKKINNLLFCGEVTNVDGLCGGYNLQYCWSSGYIAAQTINKTCKFM